MAFQEMFNGECDDSDVQTLPLGEEECQFINFISWKCIGYEVVGRTKEGKEKKGPEG